MEIVFIFYTAWAIYSGYKFMSGRSEWLDRRAPLNIIVKIALSVVVGYVIAAFYLVYLIFKFLGAMFRMKKHRDGCCVETPTPISNTLGGICYGGKQECNSGNSCF